MLQLRIREDLRAMAVKVHSTFLKAPALLEPNQQILCHFQDIHWREVLHLGREAVGVFNGSSHLDNNNLDFFLF